MNSIMKYTQNVFIHTTLPPRKIYTFSNLNPIKWNADTNFTFSALSLICIVTNLDFSVHSGCHHFHWLFVSSLFCGEESDDNNQFAIEVKP